MKRIHNKNLLILLLLTMLCVSSCSQCDRSETRQETEVPDVEKAPAPEVHEASITQTVEDLDPEKALDSGKLPETAELGKTAKEQVSKAKSWLGDAVKSVAPDGGSVEELADSKESAESGELLDTKEIEAEADLKLGAAKDWIKGALDSATSEDVSEELEPEADALRPGAPTESETEENAGIGNAFDSIKRLAVGLQSESDGEGSGQGLSSLLNQDTVIGGLKEALAVGTKKAIDLLGREDGFFDNPNVKIPLPKDLEFARKAMRVLGREKDIDTFELTLNRAAEAAIPEVASIIASAIQEMSIADAQTILKGKSDEATQYFKRTTSGALNEKILPLVKEHTDKVGVTSQYKAITIRLKMVGKLVDFDGLDLDAYVTGGVTDGLFFAIGEEEKKIRSDPAARTTELLKKVFGGSG